MKVSSVGLGLVSGIISAGIFLPAIAQVTSDGTTNSTVNINGNNFTILNGVEKGNNLFHSFSNFSVPTGGSASFDLVNTPNITTIFSRVTGGNISNIDGLIQTLNGNNPASLFLMNPNGIVFGQNASLNIGGSFFGTTANSIKFTDGTEFSAVNPNQAPLLTMSVPVGLQMGSNPGAIQVQGRGHGLTVQAPTFFPVDRTMRNPGLEVNPGQTLALIGGGVSLNGGVLTAEGGRIEIGSVDTGEVSLGSNPTTGFKLTYDNVQNFRDIQLSQQSVADVSSKVNIMLISNTPTPVPVNNSGSIQIQGAKVSMSDGSMALGQNMGFGSGGSIEVNASESLDIRGTMASGNLSSGVFNENLGLGQGGKIQISTPQLSLQEGADIDAKTFSSGDGGDISINASESMNILGYSSINPTNNSSITSTTLATGIAGNVTVSTGNLIIRDGAGVASATLLSTGNSGDVNVTADSIEVIGVASLTFIPSSLVVTSISPGDASNLTVNTGQLLLLDGGTVGSSTSGSGSAGTVTVNASEWVEVSGTVPGSVNPSNLSSSATLVDESLQVIFNIPPVPTGDAGGAIINTPELRVTDGGQVTVTHNGTGDAGSLNIAAERILLRDRGGITANSASGKGGNVVITVEDSLQLSNQGVIAANAQQAGHGGSINITASTTSLQQNSNIASNAEGIATGGELRLTSDRLSVLGGSTLSAITSGSGKAGNVFVQAGDIQISGVVNSEIPGLGLIPLPSFIGAGTFVGSSGEGGNLTVIGDRIRISDGGLINAGTFGTGRAGNATITASESIEVTGVSDLPAPLFGYPTNHPSRISASSLSNASAGSVEIQAPSISIADGAILEVNGIGAGGAGNLNLIGDKISLTNRASLQAQVAGGDKGNITLDSNLLLLRNLSTITSNATGNASGGNITINSPIIAGLENSDIIANAVQGDGGNINITTQGIFGLEFREQLTSDSDITASSQFGVNGTVNINNMSVDPSSGLVELPVTTTDTSQQIASGCADASSSSFIATGRGGIPQNPNQNIRSDRTWSDIRDISAYRQNKPVTAKIPAPANPIVQATSWRRNAEGEIELIADNSANQVQQSLTCAALPKS